MKHKENYVVCIREMSRERNFERDAPESVIELDTPPIHKPFIVIEKSHTLIQFDPNSSPITQPNRTTPLPTDETDRLNLIPSPNPKTLNTPESQNLPKIDPPAIKSTKNPRSENGGLKENKKIIQRCSIPNSTTTTTKSTRETTTNPNEGKNHRRRSQKRHK